MSHIRFDDSNAAAFLEEADLVAIRPEVEAARETLISGTGEGNDFLGWVDLPLQYDKDEFSRIKKAAEKIRSDSEVLVVIGIGGSYLGARSAIDFLQHTFYNLLPKEQRKAPEIYFAGSSLSPSYLHDLLEIIGERDFSVNVISKSGTTTEPSVAFRIFKNKLEEKYGREGAARRIYATTDKARGALKGLADAEGYEEFVIPDNVGGRFSVLTAVGLLPIAASGADIDALMEGAAAARAQVYDTPFEGNPAMQYAAMRNALYRKGYTTEILANYEPTLHNIAEWWKQLYGESEGKDKKGLFPASVDFTTDLHSMGQFIQDGPRVLIETVLHIENGNHDFTMKKEAEDIDGLNYLAGRNGSFINECAMNGTLKAHVEGGVPNMRFTLPAQDAHTLGALYYILEFACGVSGYTLGVNPFNQPGVESYKRNMFELLGKPGI